MFVVVLTAVVSLLLGVMLTLLAEWYIFSQTASKTEPRAFPSVSPVQIQLPEELLAKLEGRMDGSQLSPGAGSVTDDSSLAVNLLVQFMFRELRLQGAFRRLIIQKINQEMDEVLSKGQVRKIIRGLKIYDVDLGSRAPSISSIRVNAVDLDQERHIESLDFIFSVEYSGGFSIAIDAALAYGKSAFLSAKVSRLEGEVNLRFSRQPFSHWAFAFCRPPLLDFDIKSRVQGRSFRHVTQLVAAQIQKLIQKKHTLPRYRIRYKPFFRKPDQTLFESAASKQALSQLSNIKEGILEISVMELARLNPVLISDGVYCTLALGDCAWTNVGPSPIEGHVVLDVRVVRKKRQPLGIVFEPTDITANLIDQIVEESSTGTELPYIKDAPVIHEIQPDTPAHFAGLKPGDVVLQVDQTPVKTTDDILRILAASHEYCTLRIDRQSVKKSKELKSKSNGEGLKEGQASAAESPSLSEDISMAAINDAENTKLSRPGSKTDLHPAEFNEFPLGTDLKRTATYPMAETTILNETQLLQIQEGHRFLNVSVWTVGSPHMEIIKESQPQGNSSPPSVNLGSLFKSNKSEKKASTASMTSNGDSTRDALLGHVNIPLSEVVSDCLLNTQGHHISTYKINPSDEQAYLGRQNPLAGQVGFDPRLCYGDILLSFVYRPDEKISSSPLSTPAPSQPAQPPVTSTTSSVGASTTTSAITPSPSSVRIDSADPVSISKQAEAILSHQVQRPHDFVLTNFTNVRLCDSCNKKIWLREALQCSNCGTVCHKKCIKRTPEKNWCTAKSSTEIAFVDQNAGKSAIEGGMSDLIKVVESSLPANVSELQSYLEANPFLMSEDDEMDELHVAVDRLLSRKYDESLVSLAKDSGRHLYSQLDLAERRTKISSMITRLEAAIEIETIRRSTLAVKAEMSANSDEKKQIQSEMAVCEEKRQALALLLLHYCAGLQHTEEAEELSNRQQDSAAVRGASGNGSLF